MDNTETLLSEIATVPKNGTCYPQRHRKADSIGLNRSELDIQYTAHQAFSIKPILKKTQRKLRDRRPSRFILPKKYS
jgi:hypothetical protein